MITRDNMETAIRPSCVMADFPRNCERFRDDVTIAIEQLEEMLSWNKASITWVNMSVKRFFRSEE